MQQRNENDPLETILKGSPLRHAAHEFLTNSVHFPAANLLFEALLEGPGIALKPDVYALLLSAVMQAHFIGKWAFKGLSRPFTSNLIGPALYALVEFSLEGADVLGSPNHLAYWMFSLSIGLVRGLRFHSPQRAQHVLILSENVLRAMILFVMYVLFEAASDGKPLDFAAFMSDGSHKFILLAILFGGVMTGLGNIAAADYLSALRKTADRLREFSSWLLGSAMLTRALEDPASLELKRRERAMLFMDIRGFTAWSETRDPEEVVGMLNGYYSVAESAGSVHGAIKAKFTADEVLMFFPTSEQAMRAGLDMQRAVAAELGPRGLGAGAGIHTGQVVQGMLGSSDHKAFDIIGDAVNVASRLCSHAQAGQVLISRQALQGAGDAAVVGKGLMLNVKGKSQPVEAFELLGMT